MECAQHQSLAKMYRGEIAKPFHNRNIKFLGSSKKVPGIHSKSQQ